MIGSRSRYDYDMLVIGGGSAGLSAATIAAAMGAKTALVEAEKLGGDCTWYGCVPSKALLKAAKVAHHIRDAARFGLEAPEPVLELGEVLARVHRVQEEIYQDADAPEHFEKKGVSVLCGRAGFCDAHTIELATPDGEKKRISARYFIISTGARALVPPIPGLQDIPYLTNENLFDLKKLPEKLLVIGAGPIGLEMAQAFRRLGAGVTVVDMLDRIMVNDDPELAALLREHLEMEGIEFVLGARATDFSGDSHQTRVTLEQNGSGEKKELLADAVLLAVGRRPNIEGLNLEKAGVRADRKGIKIDHRCRTSQRHIYACGDVAGSYQFTHYASHMARVAVSSALLHLPGSLDAKHITWCTFTDPELAHVGATEQALRDSGTAYEVFRMPFAKIDRALTDGEPQGMIKVFAKRWNGKIYGASILGTNAGDLIAEYAVAMRNGLGLRHISGTIHAYPTYALGNRQAADQWYVTKRSVRLVKFLQFLFGYRGPVPDQIVVK